jgi:uncharacterized protein
VSDQADDVPFIADEALIELPVFPLPGTVLLPRTFMSLHIFEPRYRKMLEDCVEGHRVLAIAMLDESGTPDHFGRPPFHGVAGVGVLRRSARLPDGRYNIVLEGALRVDVSDELGPSEPYRRARAKRLFDVPPGDARELDSALASLRSLCARVIAQMSASDGEVMEKLNEVRDPGILADLIAAAAIQDALDRQNILAEVNILRRLNLAAAALAALLLKADDVLAASPPSLGWGIGPGKA